MNKLTRISATVVSTFALVAGFTGIAGAAPTVDLTDTGRDSTNKVEFENRVRTYVRNNTDVSLTNNNPQSADSGNADVKNNDDVGSVSTGDAMNDSWAEFNVDVDNSSSTSAAMGAGMGADWSDADVSMTDTGRDSYNKVSFENSVSTSVHNDTDICITNNNPQSATSGDAKVMNNDDVGSVSTGDASNTSTAVFSVSVTN
jgi:hypothetical protein